MKYEPNAQERNYAVAEALVAVTRILHPVRRASKETFAEFDDKELALAAIVQLEGLCSRWVLGVEVGRPVREAIRVLHIFRKARRRSMKSSVSWGNALVFVDQGLCILLKELEADGEEAKA